MTPTRSRIGGEPAVGNTWTIGEIARDLGITVRTLHHYDAIGLLVPEARTAAGYRLYTSADLERLQTIVVYRRLGFGLDVIRELLAADDATIVDHLHRQRAAVMTRMDELTELVTALDRALERAMNDRPATPDELTELFGDGYSDEYAAEAEQQWGDTTAWARSRERTAHYTKADWATIKAEQDRLNSALVAAKRSGSDPESTVAMDAAEEHRAHLHRWFYDTDYPMHRGLADLYVADPRFAASYDTLEPGLAEYVRAAIHANADRHE